MVPGFLQSVGHTIFRMGGSSGDGVKSEGEETGPMRLGHSGEPLYTTLAGHPVSDDNHRYGCVPCRYSAILNHSAFERSGCLAAAIVISQIL